MNTARPSLVMLLACCTMLAGVAVPVQAQESQNQATESVAQKSSGFAYDFKIKGVDDAALKDELRKAAQLETLKDVALSSRNALERRITSDLDSFKTILRGHGYFDAQMRYDLTQSKKDDADSDTGDHTQHFTVTIHVEKNALYTIADFKLKIDAKKEPDKARALVDAALKKGVITFPRKKDALPQYIQAPEQATLSLLMQNGYPYPHIVDRVLVVDHKKKTVDAYLSIHAGPRAVFGNTALHGLETVDDAFVERRVAWRRGETFDIRKVTKTQRDISRSGVIGSARVQYGGRPAPPADKAARVSDGASLPMRVRMDESKHKTLGAGLSYSTSLGPAANLFWEHRNVFGGAEKFRADLDVGTSIYGIGATFNKPDLMGKRSLSYQSAFSLKDESLEAYDKRGITLSNGVAWQATNRLTLNGGFGLEYARVEEKNKNEDIFTLISFPLMARYDSSDDVLNPKKGWRLALGVTPYQALNDQTGFIANEISAIHYWSLGKNVVWANRAKFGAIYGDDTADIPADKRLYSGGGGSVRGYGYQMVGPLDNSGDPTGGRMQLEASSEMRFNVTETIGGVGFVDAGRVTEDIGGSGDVLYSAGVGARYYTVAGPIRFDIAVPLNKRRQDDSFQIYISLGQAF